MWADAVFYGGKLVAEHGKLTVEIEDREYEMETRNSMNAGNVSLDDFIGKHLWKMVR